MEQKEYTINAGGQKLGRVASEAAKVLMGKHTPQYEPQRNTGPKVVISGASGIVLTEKKKIQKIYKRYSGHPGGQKTQTLEEVIDRKGASEAIRLAIYGMLPANKLRSIRMKQLTINE